ncbi:short-chain dehydrogenase [Paenibacillus sp. FSL A5-0031]|uniref:SDR family oxidoreductase n=1 Tax=Paenibacillus sp. FSL A5-0031 TaxID=1920420 RepID=UPI00096ECA91|nr:SDR family oxidoreductase [Paenibacillus sp. FSL A5-0031]OME79103.1 short-chain dehydrogenase [Paenibacillus sp. FSL A5-0031]
MANVAEVTNRPIALITGASSGFGLLTSIRLAQEGYFVIATMRDIGKKEDVLAKAKENGVPDHIAIMRLDITDSDTIVEVIEQVMERWGRIDVLVNNAGYAVMGVVEEIPMVDWRAQFDTNFFGTVAVTKAVLPHMRVRSQGKIINVSSGAGILGFSNTGAYSASKFALEGFSEALRLELLPFSIPVVLVEPGTYDTGIAAKHVFRAEQNSPYSKMIERFNQFNKKSEKNAPNPIQVANTIVKICQSRRPKLRYVCGNDAKMIFVMKKLFPWRLIEFVLRKALH